MPQRSQGPSGFENPEAAHGGADAINDTPAVPAHGAEPEEPRRGSARARVTAGRGLPVVGWVIAVLIAIIALTYVLGLL
jgi:hypothetical protein